MLHRLSEHGVRAPSLHGTRPSIKKTCSFYYTALRVVRFMNFDFDRPRADEKRRAPALEDLRQAASHFQYRRFSRREFDQVAKYCKGTTIIKIFGSWSRGLDAIGVALRPHIADRKKIESADLLSELARVWRSLGHRPSKLEWDASDARYSYTTYKQRFGGWTNACAALVAGEQALPIVTQSAAVAEVASSRRRRNRAAVPAEEKRNIPLKLRLKVLSRDQFKCVLCGRTPALHAGTVLHIDHIVPFARNGRTNEGNLRTLCEKCNWGKGVDETTQA